MDEKTNNKTVIDSGWHLSKYNIFAKLPDSDKIIFANTFKGSFALIGSAEAFLISVAETLDEDHPAVEAMKKRGILVDFDEQSALMEWGKPEYVGSDPVTITISVTQECNFNCAYCFEYHQGSRMSGKTQDDVVKLAAKMLDVSGRKKLHIIWFGGEPLLEPDIIDNMSGRLMKVAEDRGVIYSACIVTNGYLLTQDIVDMLYRNKVEQAVVGLDGVGKVHDDARPLKNGEPTFDKIIDNLRNLKIPFDVHIRHVIHSYNKDQLDELGEYIEKLSHDSGNRIFHRPDVAHPFYAPEERELKTDMIGKEDACRVALRRDSVRFSGGRGHHCGANSLWCLEIHSSGALHKCWPALDRPELSFGEVGEWDPADPYKTASSPEKLKMYLDTTITYNGDEECKECKWLPFHVGGCPYLRMFYKRDCLPYKGNPELFLLSLYERMLKDKKFPTTPDKLGGSCFSASSSKE